MNYLFGGCLGGGGRRRRKRHLDEWRWDRLESVGGGGDVVAGEADEWRGVAEGGGGDGRGVEFGEAGGGGGGALPCRAVDVGLGCVDGVSPGEGGGVLCASGGGEDEDCGECDCGGCGASFHFVILLNLVAQAFLPVPQVDWGLECVQRGCERTRWVDFAVWHGGAVGVFGHGMSKIPHGFAGPCPQLKKRHGNCKKNDVALCAKHWRCSPPSGLGHRQDCLCY